MFVAQSLVRVFGLRKRLREYLTLWVVGSLVGATQLVDMKTTRKSDFGRIFVAVLDPTIIPRKLDVVIGDHYFELKFEVEKKGFDENGEEVEFMQEGGGGDGDGSKDNEKDMRDEEEEEEGRSLKRARNDDMVVEGKEGGNGDSEEAMSNGRGEREDEEVFLGGIADEVIDVAMEKVLGEIFDNIEVEGDGREDGQKRKRREEEGAGKEEKVVQLASVKEVLLTPKRASQRLANSGELPSLEKAERRKAWKNLELPTGNEFKYSFLSFSHSHVVDDLRNIGVNLGATRDLMIESVDNFKKSEFVRFNSANLEKSVVLEGGGGRGECFF